MLHFCAPDTLTTYWNDDCPLALAYLGLLCVCNDYAIQSVIAIDGSVNQSD